MVKVKILRKQKKFLENEPPKLFRLKEGAQVRKHDPLKNLLDEDFIARAFWECLRDNDSEGAMEVIESYMYALNKAHLAKRADISRSTLYHSLKSKNPSFKTVTKLVSSLVAENSARKKGQS
jgi:DNA-binding phage protein